jgi:hypothetical protein
MNNAINNTAGSKTMRRPGPRRVAAPAVVAAVAVLAAGCGVPHVQVGGSVVTGPATFKSERAYARCMRTHGVPGFPEPANSSQVFHIHISGHRVGKVTGRRALANEACDHLLPPGSVTTGRDQ